MPTVRILLFAAAAEAVGTSSIEIDAADSLCAGDVVKRLAAEHPDAEPILRRAAVAVNERYAHPSQLIVRGDTVAIIPPVSGG